jgi:hypothetical protein
MLGIHVRLNLEHEAAELRSVGHLVVCRGPAAGPPQKIFQTASPKVSALK